MLSSWYWEVVQRPSVPTRWAPGALRFEEEVLREIAALPETAFDD